jgi:multicomponent Na+:H+ antiporter subunit B
VWLTLDLGITSIRLSTVLLFDAGVYAAVWGAFCLYLLALLGEHK